MRRNIRLVVWVFILALTSLPSAVASPGIFPTGGRAIAAFDADDDGADDVLTLEPGANPQRLVVRRGLDGSPLWTYEAAISEARTFDADDRGPHEIIVLERVTEQHALPITIARGWTISMLDIRGDSRWRHTELSVDIEVLSIRIGSLAEPRRLLDVGDADGDAWNDVLVQTADEAIVLSGESGNEIARFSLSGLWDLLPVVPVGDVDGDGRADIVTVTRDRFGNASMTARRLDGAEIWTAPPMPARWIEAPGTLTGSGVTDLFVTDRWSVSVIDGMDGAVVWDRPLDQSSFWFPTRWIDDLDGDGQIDVVCASCPDSSELFALSGEDGTILWSYELSEPMHGIAPRPPFYDVTGDGRPDPQFRTAVYCPREDGPPERAIQVDGATGELLWTHVFDGVQPAFAVDGDLDGDGLSDAVGSSATTSSVTLVAHGGWSGAERWRLTIDVDGEISEPGCQNRLWYPTPFTADVDGDDDRELVVTIHHGEAHTYIVASSGVVWSF